MSHPGIKPTNEIENITTLITNQQERIQWLEEKVIEMRLEISSYEKLVKSKKRLQDLINKK